MTRPRFPSDEVMVWLYDTYNAQGVRIWLDTYRRANRRRRNRMVRIARMDMEFMANGGAEHQEARPPLPPLSEHQVDLAERRAMRPGDRWTDR